MAKIFDAWNGKTELVILPHNQQRYDTAGDWSLTYYPDEEGTTLTISVSDTGDKKMNFALYMHELNEALLFLFKTGFTRKSVEIVDAFDKQFLENSEKGEAGESVFAPYFIEHMFAMSVEHLVAAQINLDWNEYTEAIGKLEYYPDPRDPEEPNQ